MSEQDIDKVDDSVRDVAPVNLPFDLALAEEAEEEFVEGVKERMSAASRKQWEGTTAEERKLIIQERIYANMTPEQLSERSRKIAADPDVQRRRAESVREYWANLSDEDRAKRLAGIRLAKSDKHRDKMREVTKSVWANLSEEEREARSIGLRVNGKKKKVVKAQRLLDEALEAGSDNVELLRERLFDAEAELKELNDRWAELRAAKGDVR